MPATTRSSKIAIIMAPAPGGRAMTVKRSTPLPDRNNLKWTKTEERDLIHMCRHTEMKPDEMAFVLCRTEEAVRWRLAKIFHEHLDGRTDEAAVLEVSNWLLPN